MPHILQIAHLLMTNNTLSAEYIRLTKGRQDNNQTIGSFPCPANFSTTTRSELGNTCEPVTQSRWYKASDSGTHQ